MYQSDINKKSGFRFRRWSRKSYAVFASLGRAVTIGNLRTQLAAGAFFRQIVLTVVAYCTMEENDEAEIDLLADNQESALITVQVSGSAFLPARNFYKNINPAVMTVLWLL